MSISPIRASRGAVDLHVLQTFVDKLLQRFHFIGVDVPRADQIAAGIHFILQGIHFALESRGVGIQSAPDSRVVAVLGDGKVLLHFLQLAVGGPCRFEPGFLLFREYAPHVRQPLLLGFSAVRQDPR